jgi:hypothetical protein
MESALTVLTGPARPAVLAVPEGATIKRRQPVEPGL